jgi:vacuolar-type H+-ATPase subunit E/Vma4
MADEKTANKAVEENESKFLKAIEKYAKQQRDALISETEIFEKEAIAKAEQDGLRDAYSLIHREQDAMRMKIASEMANEEAKGKLEIFKRRQEITRDVFAKAAEKLKAYAETSEYEKDMLEDARECAEFFGKSAVELCFCSRDISSLSRKLSKLFKGGCTVKEVSDIKIGGFRAYCPEKKIAADKTLDTRLEMQKGWFYENSGLKVK